MFFLWLGIAETAVLGALTAQDLALFVAFFDLMLIPFYFLTGQWGIGPGRVAGVTKLVIYTLVGSLLMLAAAVATAVLVGRHGEHINFSFRSCPAPARRRLAGLDLPVLRGGVPGEDAAVPVPRLDARRLPRDADAGAGRVLGRAVEGRGLRLPADRAAAVPARVAALPGADPADRARVDPLRVRAGVHDDRRAADPRVLLGRADGLHRARASSPCAPTAPRARCCSRSTTGSWSRRRSSSSRCWRRARAARRTCATWAAWRSARRCSATLFLIVALANLAMPGSSNFVGEFLILLGVFNSKIVIAIVAFTGVALASVYTLRLFIRTMHNRVGAQRGVARALADRRGHARAAGRRDPVPGGVSAVRPEAHVAGRDGERASRHLRAQR